MSFLITGGCGFLGSNIAAHLLRAGERVMVYDNMSGDGSDRNLTWLRDIGSFEFVRADIRDQAAVEMVVGDFRPATVFHLAGQVAMTTSVANPRLDFEVNVFGSINLLEAIRATVPETTVVYSSSNKVYGDLSHVRVAEESRRYVLPDHADGIDESVLLSFHTPYGCSKGAADQYMLDYARIYGLNTVVFRHSTIYGGRQFANYNQGWVSWFCGKALEATRPNHEPFTISGNGKQVRDLLHVDDAVRCYLAAAQAIDGARGHVFNIGGGMENSSSLLELFDFLERRLNVSLKYQSLPPRVSDQKVFVANTAKAAELLNWRPLVSKERGIELTLEWANELFAL